MSVHGEYQRSLRNLEVRLTEAADALALPWADAIAAARLDGARDLSSAARAALALVARLEAALGPFGDDVRPMAPHASPPAAEPLPALRDACHHLRAHCRAILGPGEGAG